MLQTYANSLAQAGEDHEYEENSEGESEDEEDESVVMSDQQLNDALTLASKGWRVDHPMTQPLKYEILNDASGSIRYKTIKFNVDFASRESVNLANKARRLGVWRANDRHGGVKKRASTKGREYTNNNDKTISAIHKKYADENSGARIPWAKLREEYNEAFPAENRSSYSLSSHVDRVQQLKDMRNSYQ